MLSETNAAIEIVVVDDGSTDDTAIILRQYAERVLVINQPNAGLSAARNRGVLKATGQWLAFLDADDRWLPGFSRSMIAAAQATSCETGVICCGWQYTDERLHREGVPHLPPHTLDLRALLWGNLFPVHAAIVRRELMVEVGGFNESCFGVQDWELWLRLAARGVEFERVPIALVEYRQTAGSMSRNVPRMRDNGLAVLDRFYSQPAVPPAALDMKDLAYGLVRTYAGANFIAASERNRGVEEFSHALRQHPALLRAPETYYAIACAQQPLAWKGTGRHLDLGEAEALLQEVLTRAFMSSESSDQRAQKEALAQAYRVLGRLALLQGRARQALTFSTRSLLHARSSSAARELARTCFKVVH